MKIYDKLELDNDKYEVSCFNKIPYLVYLEDYENEEAKENDTFKLEKKEKEGYVFKGWEDEAGKLYTDEVKISKNLKLKAVFEKKEDQTTQPQTSEEEKKPKLQIIIKIIILQKNIIVIKDIL